MGGLAAASSSTILLVALGYGYMLLLGIALTILLYVRHRTNIIRIRAGTEPRIGHKG
jgi:glycerol-3-phosphate acyltransferase PlsY